MTFRRFTFTFCVLFTLLLTTVNNSALAAFIPYTAESTWQAAAGTTALENFETYSNGTQIASLPALGISFDTLAGGGHPQAYLFSAITPHGPMHLGNFPNGINAINRWDDIVLRVLSGYEITALGFWNGDGQADTLVARAYDASNTLLGTVGAFKGRFAGFTSDIAISHVVFDGNTGDGWNHLDGLQTNATSTVPEPATLALLGAGLAGLGFSRRKKSA